MASLLSRVLASFQATIPVASLNDLDGEFNRFVGASGVFNGGTTAFKILTKTSDAVDPVYEMDQVGAGPIVEFKQNGTLKTSVGNDGLITCVNTAVNPGLNADRVDGIEGATIGIIGTSKIPLVLSFKIDDPTTPSLNDQSTVNLLRIPAVQSGFITKFTIIYASGSHTAGGSCTFRVFINGAGVGSGVSFTDVNATAFTFYTEDFADQAISDGTSVTVVVSARSGTVSERNVTINVEGYQTIKA
jgi:hypothetical protein